MRILVVEDEPLIRMGMVCLLEEAGFATCEAANADAAIRLLKGHDDIGLLVTDVDMRGSMDGLRLAHYVRGEWQRMPIIVVSGKVGVAPGQLPTDARFLSKPYNERHFIQSVGELVQHGPGGGV